MMISGKCPECRDMFSRKARGHDLFRFCSRQCAKLHLSKSFTEPRAVSDGYLWWANHWKECKGCGVGFVAESQVITECSAVCRRKRLSRDSAEAYARKQGTHRKCEWCSVSFERDGKRRICDECYKERARALRIKQKAKRRARIKTNGPHETIRPSVVFERDGWACKLCGIEVDRNAAVPDPKSPTVDHIVPLANGGTHTMDNVQCACFECNWRKADNAIEVDGEIVWEYAHDKPLPHPKMLAHA